MNTLYQYTFCSRRKKTRNAIILIKQLIACTNKILSKKSIIAKITKEKMLRLFVMNQAAKHITISILLIFFV